MASRILVPLDGTRSAERALPVAVNLARSSGATLCTSSGSTCAPSERPSPWRGCR
jgi:nucleotide-binding universal stress UspA family protein